MSASPVATAQTHPHLGSGANRVLWMSTLAFTLMFAVWLMFGVLGVPIQKEFGLTDVELSWISAVAVLNGSMWRLPAGMLTDRIGGRKVTIALLVLTAIPCYFLTQVGSYGSLLILAFLVGFAGNLFSVGIAWNSAWTPRERQGYALGVFGAGNVGASVTKLLVVLFPALVVGGGAATSGLFPSGWRVFPVIYYVAVFGAYVALSAWLPKYYVDNFGIELKTAALLATTFIFPASLLRPFGGLLSDRLGARRVMYWTFAVMLVATGILMMPNGHIVISHADGHTSDHLSYSLGLIPFALLVFILGCAMGVGKAAVYKHIPEYFPDNVGSVGGLVGMLGGLGGFFLPPLFAYTKQWSGFPTSTFFVLFLLVGACAIWMHWTVVQMLHHGSPELRDRLEPHAPSLAIH